ncbi:MAG: 2-C-methyl-D-erythritol 4-phosphate cytidylyltransferase [Actinomycetota bacterium]
MSDVRARTRVEDSTGPVWTVVVAGGSGRRFGAMKQYETLGDRRVVDHAVETARRAGDGVVLVLPGSDVSDETTWNASPGVIVVAGGPTRTASVRNGLAAVPADAGIVLVHDGARPFASVDLYRLVIDAVRGGADGAVPGLPVTDTVKVIEVVESASIGLSGSVVPHIVDTPDRATLLAVQTPQGFVADVLRRAYLSEVDASDDSTLVESIGGTVIAVPGEIDNRKITHPEDLVWARDLLARRDGTVTS